MVRKVLTATLPTSFSIALGLSLMANRIHLAEKRSNEKGAASLSSNAFLSDMSERLLPVLLDAGGAQAGQAMLVDGHLPAQELFGGQRVALTGFLEA